MKMLKVKYALMFVLFSFSCIRLFSQDLIVTSEGDSLNCKISRIKSNHIYFTFKYKEEVRSTLLSLNQVKTYQYNYYQVPFNPLRKAAGKEIYPRFRIAMSGGWSYRTASLADNIPSDFKQYANELKSGANYSVDFSYYLSEQLGFGFKYSLYKSRNSIDNIYVTRPDGSTQYGKMSDNIAIDFIGPYMSTRMFNYTKRNCLIMNFGIGYLGYKDKTVLITNYTIKGSTVGLCCDIGYDIGISDKLAVGFQFSYTVGTLTKYDVSDGYQTQTVNLDNNNYESLSRIDLSVGIRFGN